MENDQNSEDFFLLDSLARIQEKINPLKGSAFETMLESQNKLKQMANPFRNTAMDLLKIQNEVKGIVHKFEIPAMQLLAEQREMQSYLHKKLYPLINYEVPYLYQKHSLHTPSSFAGMKMFKSQIQQFYDKNPAYGYRHRFENVFKHIDLYENYTFKEDISEINEPSETDEPLSPIIRLDDTIRVQSLIKSVFDDNKELCRIHHFDFEDMIAELLRSKDLLVEVTKRTCDGGKDIIALQDMGGLGVNRYLVECKRYAENRPVGVNLVRSFCYTVNKEKANKGIMFTSSYFTQGAYEIKSQEKNLLELQDGMAILQWISTYLKRSNK